MSSSRQWIVVGGVTLTLVGLLAFGAMSDGTAGPIVPGSVAPDFSAHTLPDSGAGSPEVRGIASYRGKPILLNLWATWCGPCREEMPRIETLHKELGPAGLMVVAVSIDNPGMADAIREFRREMELTFEIVYDESGKIRDDYQTTGVPETFLIDRNGVIRRRLIGSSWTVNEQRPLLRELIAEPANAVPAARQD